MTGRIEEITESSKPIGCGYVVKWRVDVRRRTLFLATTTHGMTLEWPGSYGRLDEPIAGSPVELHWGDQVALESRTGLKWVSVRSTYPGGLDTDSGRVASALTVAISAALTVFALLSLARVMYLAFGTAVIDTGPGGVITDVGLMAVSVGGLLGWRHWQRRSLRTQALGIRPHKIKLKEPA